MTYFIFRFPTERMKYHSSMIFFVSKFFIPAINHTHSPTMSSSSSFLSDFSLEKLSQITEQRRLDLEVKLADIQELSKEERELIIQEFSANPVDFTRVTEQEQIEFLGKVLTEVIVLDVNKDGVDDITTTNTTVTDEAGNVVGQEVDVNAENVDATVSAVTDTLPVSQASSLLLAEIAQLQKKIKCDKTHHIGTMEDYSTLFAKYQQFVSEVGNDGIDLVLDLKDITAFADEAEIFSKMFEEVSLNFTRTSTVDDSKMLIKIRDEMTRISLMYENIQKFKATITAGSVLQVPGSIVKVTEELKTLHESIQCSLKFLNRFSDKEYALNSEDENLAKLNDVDRAAILAAERALDMWVDMVKNQATVGMSGNTLIQQFKERIAGFNGSAASLKSVSVKIKTKIAGWRVAVAPLV